MARILVVDDEPKMTALICSTLEEEGHTVTTTTSSTKALELIDKHAYDVIITDLSMPEVSGMEVLEKALAKGTTEVVMMTAYGTVETAVEAMKKGAADYMLKPFSLEELSLLVKRLIANQKLKSLAGHYAQQLKQQTASEFIGASPAAHKVRSMLLKVASTDTTVLLTGRSGTGKELAATLIHENSARREHAFIALNCAAIPETLLEAELFGHEKGAFTGAVARKRGRFELAEGGTLFLDEIGEMPASMQSKLLRVLEEMRVVRVGGVDEIEVNVRIIAATNRDLKAAMKSGQFREDLYFRLSVFPIELPVLSERQNDVIELAEYLLKSQGFIHSSLSPQVAELLKSYDWPGNVRELKNVLERAVILSGGEPLGVGDFSLEVDNAPLIGSGSGSINVREGLEMAEKELIIQALEKAGGNKTEAAKLLRITRRRLYSRMKVHGINP